MKKTKIWGNITQSNIDSACLKIREAYSEYGIIEKVYYVLPSTQYPMGVFFWDLNEVPMAINAEAYLK